MRFYLGISLITKSNDILEAFGIVIGKEQNAVINDGIRLANQLWYIISLGIDL